MKEQVERRRVLIVTGDVIGRKMAGPAIRVWNMALALSGEHDVKVVSSVAVEALDAPFELLRVDIRNERGFARLERWADVIITQGHALENFRVLRHSSKCIVADIYAPMVLERLEQERHESPGTWASAVRGAAGTMNNQVSLADFFICASERQRHFYLGMLAALGRLNTANYEGDRSLGNLIQVVPFGLSDVPPRHTADVLRGVHPAIGRDDKIILWSGGLYNWFDPDTLIRAVAELAKRRPTVRLFFQGVKHPNPGIPEMEVVALARDLATELGVAGTHVFFNESWVDYSERQNYLLEANIGVSTHHAQVETTFSFRTRILDYLWASLPMVVTDGDSFAELIAAEGLGIVVPEHDVAALAAALEKALFDDKFSAQARRNIQRVRARFEWPVVLAPLLDYVRNPAPAPDRPRAPGSWVAHQPPRARFGLAGDARKFWARLRYDGVGPVLRHTRGVIARRARLKRLW